MNRTTTLVATLFIGTCIVGGCQQVKQLTATIHAMISLSRDIGAEFHEPTVSCTLTNGNALTINIVNSSRHGLPDQDRRAAALEIARYAYSHFESRDHLSTVGVCFVRHWSIIIFNYNDSRDRFAFSGDDLAAWYKQNTTQAQTEGPSEGDTPPNNRLKLAADLPSIK